MNNEVKTLVTYSILIAVAPLHLLLFFVFRVGTDVGFLRALVVHIGEMLVILAAYGKIFKLQASREVEAKLDRLREYIPEDFVSLALLQALTFAISGA